MQSFVWATQRQQRDGQESDRGYAKVAIYICYFWFGLNGRHRVERNGIILHNIRMFAFAMNTSPGSQGQPRSLWLVCEYFCFSPQTESAGVAVDAYTHLHLTNFRNSAWRKKKGRGHDVDMNKLARFQLSSFCLS